MNCINCRKPHNGNYIMVLGTFKLCQSCDDAGKRLHQELQKGVVIESVDPKTGNTTTTTYKIQKMSKLNQELLYDFEMDKIMYTDQFINKISKV